MKIKIQEDINIVGLSLTSIGCMLFGFAFAIEAAKSSATAFLVFKYLFMTGDVTLTISVVFIFVGVFLFSIDIIPSQKNLMTTEALKIRYVLGEISKQQYDLMIKEIEVFHKPLS